MIEKINKIYEEITYIDLNASNIFISILLFLIFIGLIIYFYIKINLRLLRTDWPTNRCKPYLMPFAGLIMPQSNQSAWDYTQSNFAYCSIGGLKKLVGIATKPIYLMEQAIIKVQMLILEAIFELLRLINTIKRYLAALIVALYNKLNNILIAFLKNNLVLSDIMNRVSGIMTTQYYVAITIWYSFGAAMNTMWLNIITYFSVLFTIIYSIPPSIAAIVAVVLIVFPIPLLGQITAIPMLVGAVASAAIGVAVLIALIIICLLIMWIGPLINMVFDTHTPQLIPGDPSLFLRQSGLPVSLCFPKDTIIPTLHDGMVPIQHLTPGTILPDESIVTATMILDGSTQSFFELDSTTVTGSHKVLYRDKWICVKDHPDAISLPHIDGPIYCFNTTSKIIKLNNTIFSDWDDLEEKDLVTLNNACGKSLPEPLVFSNIHQYLEMGFHPNTTVQLHDGTDKLIKHIQVGEILADGGIVTGCVTIQGDVPLYYHDDIIGTYHLNPANPPIIPSTHKTPLLHHLLTTTGQMRINKHLWSDYNDGLERFF